MLKQLYIAHYALIDEVRLEFDRGFTTVTGETGSGKSIILGALGLVLGDRADASVLHAGGNKSIVEATFSIGRLELMSFFEEHDLDFEEETLLRRELLPSGKSRSFINDTPVSLKILKQLGTRLLDIHGQFSTLDVLEQPKHIEFLDALALNSSTWSTYCEVYKSWSEHRAEIQRLERELAENQQEQDYNAFLLKELEGIGEDVERIKTGKEQLEVMQHAETIQEELSRAIQAVSGDHGVVELLTEAARTLAGGSKVKNSLNTLKERLESTALEVKDILYDLEREAEDTSYDPEALAVLSEQIDAVNSLLFKHRLQEVEELFEFKATLQQKTDGIADLENKIEAAKEAENKIKPELLKLALKLREERSKAIKPLEDKVGEQLTKLAMPHAEICFVLEEKEQPDALGLDRVEIQIKTNKGRAFEPLSKVVSGGELSRLALVFKALIAEVKTLPTLIFDEVDTGVSGDVAHKMAVLLEHMSEHAQIMSITHLPQVAALGRRQLKVYKEDGQNETKTHARYLEASERVEEVAQMLSGDQVTLAAREQAEELLSS